MSACWHEGELRAFLDEELPAEAMEAVRHHLDECARCRARLARLQVTGTWVDGRLDVTRRESDPVPATARAYARLGERLATQQNWKERMIGMSEKMRLRWRPALVALALVVIVAASFALEPVRAVASDFLSIFRVQSFTVVPVGPEQMDRVEELAEMLDQNLFLGEPILSEQPTTVVVGSPEEASAEAGFEVRTVTTVPKEFATKAEYTVTGPATGEVAVDLEAARSLFEMVGLDPALLPDSLGEKPLAVNIAPLVIRKWAYLTPSDLVFMQGPSPTVEFPDDVDPAALAQAAFQLLGMDEREAKRLSESIDWTSTLAIPVPTDVASFSEVQVDGVTGLLLTQRSGSDRPGSALLWQKDGILYFLQGRVLSDDMIEIAASIR